MIFANAVFLPVAFRLLDVLDFDAFLEIAGLSRRLEAERAAARPLVESIRHHLPLLPPVIPDSWRTVPVVQELCAGAHESLTQWPERSMAAAKAATAIAAHLDVTYPRVLRERAVAAAWCALGAALRASGLPFQALSALARAADAVGSAHAFSDDAAMIELARGRPLTDVRQFARATAATTRARRVFASYGCVFETRVAECDELLRIIGFMRSFRRRHKATCVACRKR